MAQPPRRTAYWGTTHNVLVGAVVLVAGIVILAEGQLLGLVIVGAALLYGAMAGVQYRRGRL